MTKNKIHSPIQERIDNFCEELDALSLFMIQV